jgi:hypothetical protein
MHSLFHSISAPSQVGILKLSSGAALFYRSVFVTIGFLQCKSSEAFSRWSETYDPMDSSRVRAHDVAIVVVDAKTEVFHSRNFWYLDRVYHIPAFLASIR